MAESMLRQEMTSSGDAYNSNTTELAVNQNCLKLINTTVVFLDNTLHCFKLDKQSKVQTLLEAVFQHLKLIEKYYFGLRFTKNGEIPYTANPEVLRWLNPKKSVKKQMKGSFFYFCVKFYVLDPRKLQEDNTRYFLYLQLRKYLFNGKLSVTSNRAYLLASYIIQSELGDYNSAEHKPGYLSNLALIPGQTEDLEKHIWEFHKLHNGVPQLEAKIHFLDLCRQLNMYGVNLHKAMDSDEKELEIGVTSNGLIMYQNSIQKNTMLWDKIIKLSFKRKMFFVQLKKEMSEDYDTILFFNMMTHHSAKYLWRSCVEHHSFFRLNQPIIRPSNSGGFKNFLFGSRFSYSGRTEIQAIEENRRSRQKSFFGYKSKYRSKPFVTNKLDNKKFNSIASNGSHDKDSQTMNSKFYVSNDEHSNSLLKNNKYMANIIDDELSNYMSDIPAYDTEPSLGGDKNIVCIDIVADSRGRFGFNVMGGSDLNLPIIVSRIASGTSAERSIPKLNEGDEILMINGLELSILKHNDVINIIRAARDLKNISKLTFTVVQKGVDYEDSLKEMEEEKLIQYKPEFPNAMSSDPLIQSILLLEDGLISGSLLMQFGQLYRHKPDATVDNARTTKNKNKNRYRDILPYDSTRFILKNTDNNYINASYINMNIPGYGIVNSYIATQGPIQTTVNDFWNMVFESNSTVIVMVTALIEKGNQKCFKYWPSINKTLTINENLIIKTISEEMDTTNIIVYRKIDMTELNSNKIRSITQLQYSLWPDHGVPNDFKCLLNLVEAIRKQRIGVVEPIIIHCSAGVGRTGCIILLETALCLVESGQPIFPLEIIQQMRNQRPMMVQTSDQFKFVCICIHHAFKEGLIKPLQENSLQ